MMDEREMEGRATLVWCVVVEGGIFEPVIRSGWGQDGREEERDDGMDGIGIDGKGRDENRIGWDGDRMTG